MNQRGADQTAQMRRLVCALSVCTPPPPPPKQIISCTVPFDMLTKSPTSNAYHTQIQL